MASSADMMGAYGKRHLDEYQYWVYVIACRPRFHYASYDDIERRAKKRLGRVPNWLRMAWEANHRYYVGQTENLERRIGQHLQDKDGADFTALFEPAHIIELRPYPSRSRAERMEERIAKRYYDDENIYAYHN